MHTCISSHWLKRSWRSCPRRVNAGNKNTPSTHHPRRRNVTTLMVGLKTVTYAKISPKNGEPQRYSWGMQKKKKKSNEQWNANAHPKASRYLRFFTKWWNFAETLYWGLMLSLENCWPDVVIKQPLSFFHNKDTMYESVLYSSSFQASSNRYR